MGVTHFMGKVRQNALGCSSKVLKQFWDVVHYSRAGESEAFRDVAQCGRGARGI